MTQREGSETWFEGPRGPVLRALVMLVAPVVVFGWEFISGGFSDNGDDMLANLPQLIHSARMVLRGEILWTPALWMGMPLLAEPEFSTLYPPHLLLLLGPPITAFTIYVLAHYVVAEFGFYRYMRLLDLTPAASLFGALGYAFCGFMLGHRGHTMYVVAGAWSPFVLGSVELFARHLRRRDAIFGAFAFAMLPLAGAVQLTVYLGGLVVALAVLRAWFDRSLRAVAAAAACVVPGALIACVQIAPMLHYAANLSTRDRASYEFATALSFPPWLLSSLYLPVSPRDSETYSRIGVPVLALAVVSMLARKRASHVERAYAVVFLGALTLMLGRYVPPVARLLHALPLLGVLRGPVRHNFELGLAAAVLGAHGYDRVRDVALQSTRRWWIVGASVALVGLALLWLAPKKVDVVADTDLVAAVVIFGLLVWSLRRVPGPWRRRAWSVIALGPMLVGGYCYLSDSRHFGDHHGMIEAARRALPERLDDVRILPPAFASLANIDSFAGNTILLQDGAGALQGYSSIAYQDARDVLAVDQFGQPDTGSPLAWTPLPTLFSVTHLVLPRIACGNANVELTAGSAACVGPGKRVTIPPHNIAQCRTRELGASFSYALQATVRAPVPNAAGAIIGLYSDHPTEARELVIGRERLSQNPQLFEHRVDLTQTSSLMFLWVASMSTLPVEISGVRMRVQRAEHLLRLDEGATLVHARTIEDGIQLEPQGDTALVSRPLGDIPRPYRALMSFDARVEGATLSDVVVDLYAPGGYDPEQAQIVAPGPELTAEFRHFSRVIDMRDAPPGALFRAFTSGTGVVELKAVELSVEDAEFAWEYPLTARPLVQNVEIAGDKLFLGPEGLTGAGVNLPFRALTLDVQADVSRGTRLVLGSEPEPGARDMHAQHVMTFPSVSGRVQRTRVSLISPDVRRLRLFVANQGEKPVTIERVTLHDSCRDRGYDEPHALANGFYLYRNPAALPRSYTVARVVRVSSAREARERMLSLSTADIGKIATLDAPPPPDLSSGSVVSREESPRRVSVTVDAPDGPTLLVDNERFDSSWHVTVDDRPATMHRANGIVRGVIVPRGHHVVVFAYQVPRAVWLGLGLALLGVLALVPAPWLARRFHAGAGDGASRS